MAPSDIVSALTTVVQPTLVHMELHDIEADLQHKKVTNMNLLPALTRYLQQFDTYWSQCTYILVEHQLKRNPCAVLLEHHTISYMLIFFSANATVIEFPSTQKTRMFCPDTKMTQLQRKKWTVQFTMQCIPSSVTWMTGTFKKLDDVADTVCQALAFIMQRFVPPPSTYDTLIQSPVPS